MHLKHQIVLQSIWTFLALQPPKSVFKCKMDPGVGLWYNSSSNIQFTPIVLHIIDSGISLYRGERNGITHAVELVVYNLKKYFILHQQPILKLVDDSASGVVTFPLYKDFPGWLLLIFEAQGIVHDFTIFSSHRMRYLCILPLDWRNEKPVVTCFGITRDQFNQNASHCKN